VISVEEYQQLVKNRDKLRKMKDQAEGAYEQYKERTQEEIGCSTEEEIQKLLDKAKKKLDTKLPIFEKKEEEFKKKWTDLLNGRE